MINTELANLVASQIVNAAKQGKFKEPENDEGWSELLMRVYPHGVWWTVDSTDQVKATVKAKFDALPAGSFTVDGVDGVETIDFGAIRRMFGR